MFPTTLRNKNSNVQDVEDDDVQGEQTIDKTCPKCGNKQMKYYTVQIRSVDEGSTVFYTCEQCGHKYDSLSTLFMGEWVANDYCSAGKIQITEVESN
jgi:predicted  nucleic acid-binding Zn-ribbon protein